MCVQMLCAGVERVLQKNELRVNLDIFCFVRHSQHALCPPRALMTCNIISLMTSLNVY